MHLSYATRSSRKVLWNFARQRSLIGLSKRGIYRRWDEVPNTNKISLTRTWRRQFEQFASMEEGDCIVVANGQTDILGVALVKGPYEYRTELDNDFFSHVRNVQWLVAYEWDRGRPARIPGFDSTILRVSERSPLWRLTNVRLGIQRRVPWRLRNGGIVRERELERKYGRGGEGEEHKRLKEWVLNHPEIVVRGPVLRHHEEYRFDSGDRADIVFDRPGGKYCVVEVETDYPTPGAHQALKYRTLKCAEQGLDIKSSNVEAVVVAFLLPQDMMFFRKYGIRFARKTLAKHDPKGLERAAINFLRA